MIDDTKLIHRYPEKVMNGKGIAVKIKKGLITWQTFIVMRSGYIEWNH